MTDLSARVKEIYDQFQLDCGAMQTVRDATFDALRRRGLLTLFANPGPLGALKE